MAEKINVLVGADVTPLQSGMKEAVSVIKQSGQQITAASEQVAATSGTAYKSLQQAYRQTYKDAQILAQQQGVNSDAFKEAARRAAEYKDHLDDVQDAIKGSSGEQQWKLVGTSISSAMNIAQGFVGVMALIGDESEDAQKTIAKMMALSGIAQAINSVMQLKDAFVALNVVTQTSVLGIAAVVAGLVVYTSTIEDASDSIERLKGVSKSLWDDISSDQKTVMETEKLIWEAKQDGREKDMAQEAWRNKWSLKELQFQLDQGTISEFTAFRRRQAEYEKHKNALKAIDDKYAPAKRVIEPEVNLLFGKIDSRESLADRVKKSIDLSAAKDVMDKNAQILKQAKIPITNFINGVKEEGIKLDNIIQSTFVNAFDLLGQTIADVFNNEVDGTKLLQSIGGILASFLQALGAAMIAAGVASESFKALFITGVPAIIAGGALIATAGLVRGLLKSGPGGSTSSGGGGGTTTLPNYAQPAFANTSTMIEVGGIVRGNDLRIVLNNNNRQVKRVR